MQPNTTSWCVVATLALAMGVIAPADTGAAPVGTSFTYQGTLAYGTGPANGAFDFRFILYNADSGGSQVGSTVLVDDLTVADGRVVTLLDFGAVFTGDALWLEVAVREGASLGGYTTLSPRQPLSATPFAQRAVSAESAATAATATSAGYATSAGNAAQLNGQAPSYYLAWANLTGVPTGLADGDDDTLAGLSCAEDQVVTWSGGAWTCADAGGALISTFVVGPGGADAVANGTALLAAVAALPTASETNPLLLRLEPGLYDLSAWELRLPQWVDLEGSGRGVTTLTSAMCSSLNSDGALEVVGHSEVRGLSVRNTCSGGSNYGIGIVAKSNARLTSVEVTSAGNATYSRAIQVLGDSVTLTDVRVAVAAGSSTQQQSGIYGESCADLTMSDVTVSVDGGASCPYVAGVYWLCSGELTARGLRIDVTGTDDFMSGMYVHNPSDIHLENLWVEVVTADATATTSGVTLWPAAVNDVSLSNVKVRTESVGGSSTGLRLDDGYWKTTLSELDIYTSGSPGSVGLMLASVNSTANAFLWASRVISGGTGLWLAKYSTLPVSMDVEGSVIHGLSNSIRGANGAETVRVGGSKLSGGAVSTVTATCAGVWDESYVFSASTCP